MNYKLNIEAKVDYTQMSIMAGELYLIDQKNRKTHIAGMALGEKDLHYFFIENNTKFVFIVLENLLKNGINDWCTQVAIADIATETISYYDTYFANEGETIMYEKGVITVFNERNNFAKTDSFNIKTTKVERTKKFQIFGNHNHYFKRHWNELRADNNENWGKSEWLFETDPDGNILKQIEIYEIGIVQCYDSINKENYYGGLGKLPLPLDDFKDFGICKEDFQAVWKANNKVIKNDLYQHLKRIEPKPALYLGNCHISKLSSYIDGYHGACDMKGIEEKLEPRWELFQEFTKRKTGFGESTGGWCYMILTHCNGDEEKGLTLFFEYFNEFLTGNEINEFIQTLVPKHKHDWNFDKGCDILWYGYKELKPVIPQLLTWLQDINWPVAKPISTILERLMPDILEELKAILEGNDGCWKYNILKVFFIDTKSEYWKLIENIIENLAFNPSENDKNEEVHILALEIIQGE